MLPLDNSNQKDFKLHQTNIELISITKKDEKNNDQQRISSSMSTEDSFDIEKMESNKNGPMKSIAICCKKYFPCLDEKRKRMFKIVFIILILILYHIYLGFAIARSFENALAIVVLTILSWLLVLYYKVVRPYCFPKFIAQNCCSTLALRCKQKNRKSLQIILYVIISLAILAIILVSVWDKWQRLNSLVGFITILALLYIFSEHTSKVNWRPVFWGFGIQFLIGIIAIKWKNGMQAFQWVSDQVILFLDYSQEGATFVYGFLTRPPMICGMDPVLMFSALQAIIFFSAVVAILYHLRVMQFVLAKLAWLMQITLRTTSAESLHAVASIILGMCETAIMITPYLPVQTNSEMFAILCSGFSTSAASMFAAYSSFGICPQYLLIVSIMAAPASLACSKLFYPETEKSQSTNISEFANQKSPYKNILDAIGSGASGAIMVVLENGACLVVFISLLAFVNAVISWLGAMVGLEGLTLEVIINANCCNLRHLYCIMILSYIFFPIAFLMGVSDETNMQARIAETLIVSELMGTNVVLNEFIAFQKLGKFIQDGKLSARAQMMATFALCNFSNLGSIGIQLGTYASVCSEQRVTVSRLAFKAMIAGCAVAFTSACLAGILVETPQFCNAQSAGSFCFNLTSAVQQ
ncbi:Solute carrier family 28 member 3 [Trichinella pseudospiralis]|uniref:Solute carrier family 28 member 3 n=1 Tax=Trichinella pseudospiralis TaxID=6337 RepID=A0A0V1IYH4_TRIPS|nr:Solute carrier family 28 member 3 [Trichinella pseudospiralis]KRZ39294.1 Solute carrier family 28 member 3 [Trichinella pseudospiralis]